MIRILIHESLNIHESSKIAESSKNQEALNIHESLKIPESSKNQESLHIPQSLTIHEFIWYIHPLKFIYLQGFTINDSWHDVHCYAKKNNTKKLKVYVYVNICIPRRRSRGTVVNSYDLIICPSLGSSPEWTVPTIPPSLTAKSTRGWPQRPWPKMVVEPKEEEEEDVFLEIY